MIKSKNNSFYNKFRRGAAGLLMGMGLIGLAGCATTGGYAADSQIDYIFLDSYKGYRLVERKNEIYLEKIDGEESRQITHTPNIQEDNATISKDGKYIVYSEYFGKDYKNMDHSVKELIRQTKDNHKYYIIEYDSDDTARKEISFEDIRSINIERERYKEY